MAAVVNVFLDENIKSEKIFVCGKPFYRAVEDWISADRDWRANIHIHNNDNLILTSTIFALVFRHIIIIEDRVKR